MLYLFGQDQNEAINKWLSENPLVLGSGALVLGGILAGLGINALRSGEAVTKRGKKLKGTEAQMMGYVWLGFGVLAILFGLFKFVSGLLAAN